MVERDSVHMKYLADVLMQILIATISLEGTAEKLRRRPMLTVKDSGISS